jgi:DNA mismatch repair ATPase MutS
MEELSCSQVSEEKETSLSLLACAIQEGADNVVDVLLQSSKIVQNLAQSLKSCSSASDLMTIWLLGRIGRSASAKDFLGVEDVFRTLTHFLSVFQNSQELDNTSLTSVRGITVLALINISGEQNNQVLACFGEQQSPVKILHDLLESCIDNKNALSWRYGSIIIEAWEVLYSLLQVSVMSNFATEIIHSPLLALLRRTVINSVKQRTVTGLTDEDIPANAAPSFDLTAKTLNYAGRLLFRLSGHAFGTEKMISPGNL